MWAKALGMTVEENPLKAHNHVWESHSKLPITSACDVATVLWSVLLAGKRVLDLDFLWSAGKRGASVKYKQQTLVPRTMFITPNFARENPRITETLLFYSKQFCAGSKWKYEPDRSLWVEAVRKAVNAARPTTVIAFGTEADYDADDMQHVKLFYTQAGVGSLLEIDRNLSILGLDAAEWKSE